MTKFVQIRDLKNQATALLREVETGTTLIVTRRGKPIATLKPFDTGDVQGTHPRYPTTIYDTLRQQIAMRDPALTRRAPAQAQRDFDKISAKICQGLPFKTWQDMDRAAKGGYRDLPRQ